MLIIANLYPLFGVLQHGWSLFSVVYIYWLEFLILTFFDVLKILLASKEPVLPFLAKFILGFKFLMIRLFIFAFYMLFIIVFLGVKNLNSENTNDAINFANTISLHDAYFRMALFQFFIYNLLYFVVYFVVTKRYKIETPFDNFNFFDRRILVVHLSIFIGAFIYTYLVESLHVTTLKATLLCVSIFILVKIIPDLFLPHEDDSTLDEVVGV